MALREIQKKDLALILGWRNHPLVRHSMLSSELISYDEHLRWFEHVITSDSSVYLIFEDSTEPLGVIYIQDWDVGLKAGKWGFYKAPNAKRGLGRIMCEEGLEYFFNDFGAQMIKAEVLVSNTRSLELHLRLGFIANKTPRELPLDNDRCVQVWDLTLSNSQWGVREK